MVLNVLSSYLKTCVARRRNYAETKLVVYYIFIQSFSLSVKLFALSGEPVDAQIAKENVSVGYDGSTRTKLCLYKTPNCGDRLSRRRILLRQHMSSTLLEKLRRHRDEINHSAWIAGS